MQLLFTPATLLALAVALTTAPLAIMAQNPSQIPEGFDPSQIDPAAASSLLAEASASGITEIPTNGELPTDTIPSDIPTGVIDPALNGTEGTNSTTNGTTTALTSTQSTATSTTPLPTSTSSVTSHPTSTPTAGASTPAAAPGSLLDHVSLMVLSVPMVLAAANAF